MPAGRPPWTPVTPTETMSWSVTSPLTCHVRHRLGCFADSDCTAHLQLKDIGSGNFGVAKLMRYKTTGELVAVKFIERGDKVLLCCRLAATMPFVKAPHGSQLTSLLWGLCPLLQVTVPSSQIIDIHALGWRCTLECVNCRLTRMSSARLSTTAPCCTQTSSSSGR